jgi:hypothetical protein
MGGHRHCRAILLSGLATSASQRLSFVEQAELPRFARLARRAEQLAPVCPQAFLSQITLSRHQSQ